MDVGRWKVGVRHPCRRLRCRLDFINTFSVCSAVDTSTLTIAGPHRCLIVDVLALILVHSSLSFRYRELVGSVLRTTAMPSLSPPARPPPSHSNLTLRPPGLRLPLSPLPPSSSSHFVTLTSVPSPSSTSSTSIPFSLPLSWSLAVDAWMGRRLCVFSCAWGCLPSRAESSLLESPSPNLSSLKSFASTEA
ncbi:hypothetical protein GALMADRAFT_1129695 [Galerina marginata CBS 339.88]|uniref:Uncharacterized protein n=1 Tax=Galerina marginata (strain CBS 339.88) TaxID=685588 RepID=A0A067SAY0_GALM3|nr:hypothetical protein GALMADRAFT_1129695 [Galerina marginata CBS 339.88]